MLHSAVHAESVTRNLNSKRLESCVQSKKLKRKVLALLYDEVQSAGLKLANNYKQHPATAHHCGFGGIASSAFRSQARKNKVNKLACLLITCLATIPPIPALVVNEYAAA